MTSPPKILSHSPPSAHNVQKAPNADTITNALNIKIVVDMAVVDSVATVNFILPDTKVSNMKISKKPLIINLPDDTQLKSTHTCEINVPRLPKEARQAHVVPGMAHTSLIPMKILTDAGCKVVYDAHECRVYFRDKIVWTGGKEPTTVLWVLHISKNGETSSQDENDNDLLNLQLRKKEHMAANAYAMTIKEALIRYFCQCLFSPTKKKISESNRK